MNDDGMLYPFKVEFFKSLADAFERYSRDNYLWAGKMTDDDVFDAMCSHIHDHLTNRLRLMMRGGMFGQFSVRNTCGSYSCEFSGEIAGVIVFGRTHISTGEALNGGDHGQSEREATDEIFRCFIDRMMETYARAWISERRKGGRSMKIDRVGNKEYLIAERPSDFDGFDVIDVRRYRAGVAAVHGRKRLARGGVKFMVIYCSDENLPPHWRVREDVSLGQ